jgi:hypothetical protein
VAVEPEAAAGNPARVTPQPNPALFRFFADLTPDRESILQFANRHGDLFRPTEVTPSGRSGRGPVEPRYGTWLAEWQDQIDKLRRLVGLWELLQREDREGLARHIHWRTDPAYGPEVSFDSDGGVGEEGVPPLGFQRVRDVIASRYCRPDGLERFQVGDPVAPARVYLQREIDVALHQTQARLFAGMDWDDKENRPVFRLEATTLAGAVWLQFADAFSNNRTYSRCRECGAWFEVAPDLARTNRRFCSNGCRSKAYRERQDRARQLFMAQRTFEQIAEELDSDTATVKRWITGSKE